MRTELYEQYKTQHPEEMTRLNTLRAYTKYVEVRRRAAQKTKLDKIAEWERRLAEDGDNHSGRSE